MQHPLTGLWRAMPMATQRTRRLWVVAAFSGYPLLNVGYAGLVATGRLSSSLWAPIAIVLFTSTLAGVVAIYGYARDRASMTGDLDERERHVRDQAWIAAYGVLTTVLVLALAALAGLNLAYGPITVGMDVLTPVFVGLGLYVPVLPAAMLAWQEPDAPHDEPSAR